MEPQRANPTSRFAQDRYRVAIPHGDTGFDAHSHRQFCSRCVREVLLQGAGVEVGRVETFQALLRSAPEADVGFWRVWYLGSIPWQRETVTPASVLHTPGLRTIFDGTAI